MDVFRNDLRQGMRKLAASPGFAVVAIVTLAIGIGANTAIFSAVNGVILKPVDYPRPDRIVIVSESNPSKGFPKFAASPTNFLDWKQQNHVFSHIATLSENAYAWKSGGQPQHVDGALVSGDFFGVLGIRAIIGRVIREEDAQVGHDTSPYSPKSSGAANSEATPR